MTKQDLIVLLGQEDPNRILTATFYPLKEKQNVTIFSPGYEYIEIYTDNGEMEVPEFIPPQTPTLIGEAIEELMNGEWRPNDPIILTLGNEEEDVVSSMGGVEWKDGELYLNTETCSRQL
jgi:hypothetical protein